MAEATERHGVILASGTDEEPLASNQRSLQGPVGSGFFWFCVGYTAFHLLVLNVFPLETWTFRILHVAGGLIIGYILMTAWRIDPARAERPAPSPLLRLADAAALALGAFAVVAVAAAWAMRWSGAMANPPPWLFAWAGPALLASVALAIAAGWLQRHASDRVAAYDWALVLGSITVALYLLFNLGALQFRAGVMPTQPDFLFSLTGVVLILEVTRRLAGLALVVIAGIFIAYAFVGPFLPGFLNHSGYRMDRFFTYLYTDNGILGPTTAVSSTYIIMFIAFAAFLQASKVGDYFVNFAFAVAGRARGGPAKVAVFASGLMGMINGTSAGNVVATGSLTIPLMKRVGYRPKSAGAIEAAASTGGQIMPPIMGAGAFIMAEVTGIPYTDIIVAALIPAVLYFASVYFMVDFEADRMGMKGLPAEELPQASKLIRQAYLFIPILILVGALFMGYSVIRAGTLALVSAIVASWFSAHRMGLRSTIGALDLSAKMAVQLIAVCACAGVIVGVIGLTGVGLRFSGMLLRIAEANQLLALVFAMSIAILLGMGMPTTAAYAVAASVVAPGLVQLGISPLVAHFFVFYYAVISAITPPVALAAYAGAAIAGSEPMATSVSAFKLGLAAFIVPFMFFYSPGLLMQGEWATIAQNVATASVGVYLLAASVQGWFFGKTTVVVRVLLLVASLGMISGGLLTDLGGVALGLALFAWQKKMASRAPLVSGKTA